VSTAVLIHREAMQIYQGVLVRRYRAEMDGTLERDLFWESARLREAAALEWNACRLTQEPPAGDPTWSILHASAASLHFQSGQFGMARAILLKVLRTPTARQPAYIRGQCESLLGKAEAQIGRRHETD